MEVLSAQFIIGVQIGQEITTGVSKVRRPEYGLGADRLGVWVAFQGKQTLIPWPNISYMVCKEPLKEDNSGTPTITPELKEEPGAKEDTA